MSSSNRVRIAAIAEATYGVTPVAGDFKTVRFTSEGLSGTPGTTESQQLRSDRLSSGQVVTDLEVGGEINHEMAKEDVIEDFMESAMFNAWNVLAPITRDLEIDATAKKIIATTGDFTTELKKGDFAKLSTFVETENNVWIICKNVTALEIDYISALPLVDEVKANAVITRADKLTIGTTQKSFSMEKKFMDLTDKAINYRGMIAGTMSLSANYGELMTATFGFSGNDYKAVDTAGEAMTNGRTVTAPATTRSLNGSVDMPFLATSATGAELTDADLCIQSLGLELDNNLQDLTCIGRPAPEGYDAGTAAVSINISTYLKNTSWALLSKKLTQEPFEIAGAVQNAQGGYAFYLPAVQVSFDDPSSGGQNQQVSLEMEGTGMVGPNGESSLTLFRLPA